MTPDSPTATESADLVFRDEPDHENPRDSGRDNRYVVELTATSGTDPLSTTQTIVVTVTDEDEPPAKPDAPAVTPGSLHSTLDVNWRAPSTPGHGANQRLQATLRLAGLLDRRHSRRHGHYGHHQRPHRRGDRLRGSGAGPEHRGSRRLVRLRHRNAGQRAAGHKKGPPRSLVAPAGAST